MFTPWMSRVRAPHRPFLRQEPSDFRGFLRLAVPLKPVRRQTALNSGLRLSIIDWAVDRLAWESGLQPLNSQHDGTQAAADAQQSDSVAGGDVTTLDADGECRR